MNFWGIVRELESGGSTFVGLNLEGSPFYSDKKNSVKFADKESANRYLPYCKKHLPKYEGQLNFKVVESEI